MAFAAAARRSLTSQLARLPHPALPHLLTSHSSDDPPPPSPLQSPPLFRSPHFPLPQSSGTALTLAQCPFGIHLAGSPRRGFSSSPSYGAVDAGAVLTDAAGAATPAASFPSEVVWAAEDSSLSVAAVQHLIDAVHSFTGLNWWISIALSTVLLRCVLFTLLLNARKRVLVMLPEISALTKLRDDPNSLVNDDKLLDEAMPRLLSVGKRLALPTFILVLTPYTFTTLYFAISNMVEKVPSLKEGGAFWFTDLTTPDALYFFPVMTSLFIMFRLEFYVHYSRTKRSIKANTTKAASRILALLCTLLTASLPQAIGCYFVTWSFLTLTERIVLHQPAVKKLLYGELIKPTPPSSDGPKGPAAEDSPCPTEEHEQEQPLPSERRKASDSTVHEQPLHSERKKVSDASVHGARDQSDKKSAKDI